MMERCNYLLFVWNDIFSRRDCFNIIEWEYSCSVTYFTSPPILLLCIGKFICIDLYTFILMSKYIKLGLLIIVLMPKKIFLHLFKNFYCFSGFETQVPRLIWNILEKCYTAQHIGRWDFRFSNFRFSFFRSSWGQGRGCGFFGFISKRSNCNFLNMYYSIYCCILGVWKWTDVVQCIYDELHIHL